MCLCVCMSFLFILIQFFETTCWKQIAVTSNEFQLHKHHSSWMIHTNARKINKFTKATTTMNISFSVSVVNVYTYIYSQYKNYQMYLSEMKCLRFVDIQNYLSSENKFNSIHIHIRTRALMNGWMANIRLID